MHLYGNLSILNETRSKDGVRGFRCQSLSAGKDDKGFVPHFCTERCPEVPLTKFFLFKLKRVSSTIVIDVKNG